ncbi:hypothetical protein Hanom_Chr02g00142781 [Helianthus anomalus]
MLSSMGLSLMGPTYESPVPLLVEPGICISLLILPLKVETNCLAQSLAKPG